MMEFDGAFTCEGSPEDLWQYFTDPDILRDCAPGCEDLTLVSPSRLTATLSVGVGSVKPSFDVEGVVVECDRPDRLELQASGTASRNSFEVSAWQELTDNGDGTTTVEWRADADVSGIIASLGERALGSVADRLVTEFFTNLEDHVNAGTPAESQLEAASSEELSAAGYEPDDEPTVEADAAGPVGALVEGGLGVGQSVPSPDRTGVLSSVAGGVLGAILWNRFLGGDGRRGPGRSFVLGTAVGVVGTLLWQSRDTGDAGSVRDEGTAGESSAADGADADGAADGADADGAADGSASGDGPVPAPADGSHEDPLDRLVSR
jgi:carbon monoxide dehydrogenase subunit G